MADATSIIGILLRLCMSLLCSSIIYGAVTLYLFRGEDILTATIALKDFHPVAVIVGMIVFLIVFYLSGLSNEKSGAPF
jgi:DMSO/TMAO reductase YedYZ heme-binding membrane subunit